MSVGQDREAARRVLARDIALFRFGLIHEVLDPGLTAKQRGRLVRAVAAGEHPGPFGAPVRVSRANLDRWLRAYRTGGFTALVPVPRRVTASTPPEVLELAVALKKEAPGRTAAQIAAILAAQSGWAPSERTLQRHFADLGFSRTRADGSPAATFGRFEAERPNVRWVGDALHGPVVAGRKAILIAFLDDHSRLVVAARWGYAENAVALRETLRAGLASRGRPSQIYVVVLDTPSLPSKRAATCGNDTPRRSLTFQVETRIVRWHLPFAGSKKVCGERWRASPGPGGSTGTLGCAA